MYIKCSSPVTSIPKRVSLLMSMFFFSFRENPALCITLVSHPLRYPKKSSSSHCIHEKERESEGGKVGYCPLDRGNDIQSQEQSCTEIEVNIHALRRKSSLDPYGSWNIFLFFFPQWNYWHSSSRRSNPSSLSIWLFQVLLPPMVICSAFDTESLKTCIVYTCTVIFILRPFISSNLSSQIHPHLRKRR